MYFYLHWWFVMSVGAPGTEITDYCELPCGYWELDVGPLEEQLPLLTSEPSLLKKNLYIFIQIVP